MSAKNAGGISLIRLLYLSWELPSPEVLTTRNSLQHYFILSGDLASVPNGADETLQNIVLIVLATISN